MEPLHEAPASSLSFTWAFPGCCLTQPALEMIHFILPILLLSQLISRIWGILLNCFNMCSVCLFTCKCVTSYTCSRAFYLLIKHFVRKWPNVLIPNCSSLRLSTTDDFFFSQVSVDKFSWFSTINIHFELLERSSGLNQVLLLKYSCRLYLFFQTQNKYCNTAFTWESIRNIGNPIHQLLPAGIVPLSGSTLVF